MSDQQQRTQWALDLFRSFVKSWTPSAVQASILDQGGSATQVIGAIVNIAPKDDDTSRVGWAVFRRVNDTEYSRERPSGWVHTMVSAVFEEPAQATNALSFLQAKHMHHHFIVCEIREIP